MPHVPSPAQVENAIAALLASGACLARPRWCASQGGLAVQIEGYLEPTRSVLLRWGIVTVAADGWYDLGWQVAFPDVLSRAPKAHVIRSVLHSLTA